MGSTKLACLDLDTAAIMYDQHTNPNQDKLCVKKAIWSCTYINYKKKTESNRVQKNYQATECEDIQVKAEDHGINPFIVNDTSWTFKVPKRYMKLIQEISGIVHEFTSPKKLPLMYQISILRRQLVSICWRKSRFVRAFQPPAPIWIQHPGIQTKNPLRNCLQR
jgi:hypothetical protein